MHDSPVRLLALLAALILTAAGGLWLEQGDEAAEALARVRFQRSIGGLGLGAVTAPVWNWRDFDPRQQGCPEDDLAPLPGAPGHSPERLTMVSAFSSVTPRTWTSSLEAVAPWP